MDRVRLSFPPPPKEGATEKACSPYRIVPVPFPPLWVARPTTVLVAASVEGHEDPVGTFECEFVQPAPLSSAEIMAIRSRPHAAKFLRFEITCTKCKDRIVLVTCVDKELETWKREADSILLREAADEWVCSCGSSKIPLTYMKSGLHDLFRRAKIDASEELVYTPLYHVGALAAIRNNYQQLIESHPSEEPVQQFLQKNPVVWHFLAPSKIIPKPAVLVRLKADFAILSANKILYLVEIEKPNTKLAVASGGMHSQLQKGLDQIKDWRVVVQNNRRPFIEELGLKDGEVDDVRYILVAGLSHGTNPAHLMTLQRNMPHDVSLYTFDDLSAFLHSTECELARL
jgi:hypothetical protein